MHLINEALARARMREPQIDSSEAHRPKHRRSARRIAMSSRREQDRRLGAW